jgi:glutathione reductase (NADPH)
LTWRLFPSAWPSSAAATSRWNSRAFSTAWARASRSCTAAPLFLRGFDADIRAHAAQEIARTGVELRFEVNVESISAGPGGLKLSLSDDTAIEVDAVLYATGRKANLQDLGLESVNVALNDDGTIKVDEDFRTSEPSIFALGDVTGGIELTPVALAEGMSFARRQFGGLENTVDYDFIPTAVFCQPNIGTVGFTEEEAHARFGHIRLFKSTFKPMKHTIFRYDDRPSESRHHARSLAGRLMVPV